MLLDAGSFGHIEHDEQMLVAFHALLLDARASNTRALRSNHVFRTGESVTMVQFEMGNRRARDDRTLPSPWQFVGLPDK